MLQPRGVMIVFQHIDAVGKAQGSGNLHLVIRHIRPVTSLAFCLPELGHGHGFSLGQLLHIVENAVFITEIRLLEAAVRHLGPQPEGNPGIDHRLTFEDIRIILRRNIDVRKHVQIGHPVEAGAGLLAVCLFGFQTADVFALFKVQGIFLSVPANHRIKIA